MKHPCWKAALPTLFFCLFHLPAQGAEDLTLADALVATVTRNPELQAFGYALQAQEGRILQAGLGPRPELNVTVEDVLGTGTAQGIAGSQATLSIGWIIEGSLPERRIDEARSALSLLADEAEIMRLDAAAETARRFTVALAQQLRMVTADEAIQFAEEAVATVERRMAAGTAPAADLARARALLAERILFREDITHEQSSANHRLAAQWGDVEPEFSRVAGDPLSMPVIEPFAMLVERMDQNPDLRRFLSEKRLHEASLRLQEAQRKAPWRFSAGIRRLQTTQDTGFVAGITIPFGGDNRNQGNIAEARANLQRSAADEAAARVRMQASLFVFYQALEHGIHRVETLRDTIIPLLEEAQVETRRAYELGSYSYLEWLLVQEELLDARTALTEASLDVHQQVIEIERLTGVRIAQSTTSP